MRIGDRNIADWGIVTGFKINVSKGTSSLEAS